MDPLLKDAFCYSFHYLSHLWCFIKNETLKKLLLDFQQVYKHQKTQLECEVVAVQRNFAAHNCWPGMTEWLPKPDVLYKKNELCQKKWLEMKAGCPNKRPFKAAPTVYRGKGKIKGRGRGKKFICHENCLAVSMCFTNRFYFYACMICLFDFRNQTPFLAINCFVYFAIDN